MSKCKICKTKIEESFLNVGLSRVCSHECAAELAMQNLSKIKKAEKSKQRKELKSFNNSDKKMLKRKAIQVFNEYIRKRDEKLNCVSCGCEVKPNMAHASHFKPANAYSYLRFDESNVHKSCLRCNLFLSGNLDAYRREIVNRIGQKELDRLDQPNKVKNWSEEELKEIIFTYKQKIKNLQSQ